MEPSYWLDFGGGDAEYVRIKARGDSERETVLVCLDPMLRPGMIAAGRVQPSSSLPANVARVCGGLGPSDECGNRALPFRGASFEHLTCRFVLHLYLSIADTFVSEAQRVLRPGGDLSIRLPALGDPASAANVAYLARALAEQGLEVTGQGAVEDGRFSVWDEVYAGHAYEITARK